MWYRSGLGLRRISTIFDPRSVDAYGRGSCQDLCTYRMGVEWGVVRGYFPALEQDALQKWVQGGVALGLDIGRRRIVYVKKCEYAMDRRFRDTGRPEGKVVWAVEEVKAHADVELRIPMKRTAGGEVAVGLDSWAIVQTDYAPENVRGIPSVV